MRRVLITGGSGFIGTNLIQYCLARGDHVQNIDIRPPRNPLQKQHWKAVNILHLEQLEATFRDFSPDWVFHLAARTDLNEKADIAGYAANIDGVRNLLHAVGSARTVKRCIYASSQLVCRVGYTPRSETDYRPNTLYGRSKVFTETIVRENDGGGVEWCIVRPTTVWGPWCSPHYRSFFDLIRKGRYFHIGSRDLYKSFSYVGNFCHQVGSLMTAASEEIHGKTLYVADYIPTSLRQWAEAFQREFGSPKIRSYPVFLARIAAGIGDAIALSGFSNFPFTSFRLNNMLTEYVFDMPELQRIVPQLPYAMNRAVKETANWVRIHASSVA